MHRPIGRDRRLPAPPLGQLPQPYDNRQPPVGYAPALEDRWAIADLVARLAPGAIDEDMVAEMYEGCRAVLRFVPLAELSPGPAEANVPSPKREARYAKLPAATLPPLLVDEGRIMDGHHRYRVAQAAGATGLWAYVIEADTAAD